MKRQVSVLAVIGSLILGAGPTHVVAGENEEPISGNALDMVKGKETYQASCAQCHDAGTGGAPRLQNLDDWNASTFKSFSVMEKHALKGYINMPQKGGYPLLTEQDIANAVFFMQQQIVSK